MSDNVLDVLLYLFDHCMDQDIRMSTNYKYLINELEAVGFGAPEIHTAVDWLDSLHCSSGNFSAITYNDPYSFRIFTADETYKMNLDCQGFLLFLQQCKIIDALTRELIIDRAMALASDKIALDELKWIALLVLFTKDEGCQAEWLEEILFSETSNLPN